MENKETKVVSFPDKKGDEEKKVFFEFTDVCIFVEDLKKSLFYYAGNLEPVNLPNNQNIINEFKKFVTLIINIGRSQKKEDFIVLYEDLYFRCCAMNSVEGMIISVRKMPIDFLELKKLNIPDRIIKELLSERLNEGGLIFICGSPGNGKTTTSSALLKKRLEIYGGMCISIEDPPEIPIHGRHGKGFCIQTQMKNAGFSKSIKTSLRSYPSGQISIMFVGEIRDAETAVEVLKASIDGRLIITTFHSDSVVTGLKRLTSLASEALGDEAYALLSEAFRLGIHQKLTRTDKQTLRLNIECLVNTTSVINSIKNKNFNGLRNDQQMQLQKLKNNIKHNYHTYD